MTISANNKTFNSTFGPKADQAKAFPIYILILKGVVVNQRQICWDLEDKQEDWIDPVVIENNIFYYPMVEKENIKRIKVAESLLLLSHVRTKQNRYAAAEYPPNQQFL